MSRESLIGLVFTASLCVCAATSCSSDSDCEIDGQVCEDSVCSCIAGYITNSYYTACVKEAHGIGDACTDNLQCSTALNSGGYCNNGSCACLDGYHYLVGYCWKTAGLGDECAQDHNCFIVNDFEAASCSEDKICVCSEGYYQREYSSCRRASYAPGETCGVPMDCKFDNSTCFWNRTCGYANVSSNTTTQLIDLTTSFYSKSLGSSQIGDNCTSSDDCGLNTECDDGVCTCMTGFYSFDNTSCHPELGSSCSSDSDCLGWHTFCRNQTHCACEEGFTVSENRRYCDKYVWCSYFGPGGVCVNKKCTCNSTTHYEDEEMYCWVTRLAGETCLVDIDCGTGTMSCTNGVCTCPNGTHASSTKEACHEDATTLGANCTETLDCTLSHTECTDSMCTCASGYYASSGECAVGINGPCQDDSNCTVEYSVCSNSTCICDTSYVADSLNSTCLEITTSMYGSCSESQQCSDFDATCQNGICDCTNGTHYVSGWTCFTDVQLGSACTKSGECVAAHSECFKYVCACQEGYTAEDGICSSSTIISASLYILISMFFIL